MEKEIDEKKREESGIIKTLYTLKDMSVDSDAMCKYKPFWYYGPNENVLASIYGEVIENATFCHKKRYDSQSRYMSVCKSSIDSFKMLSPENQRRIIMECLDIQENEDPFTLLMLYAKSLFG